MQGNVEDTVMADNSSLYLLGTYSVPMLSTLCILPYLIFTTTQKSINELLVNKCSLSNMLGIVLSPVPCKHGR